jgi:predicted permease
MWFKTRRDPRIGDEVRFHRDRLIEDAVARGLDRGEAERRAFLELGNVAVVEEATRDARGRWLEHVGQDLRYAQRMFRRSPAFATVAVLSLALGIGANTAILSLVDTVLLRALPVERADELVFLETVGSAGRSGAPPAPCFVRLRRETPAFAGMAAFATDDLRLEVDGRVEQVFGQVASGSYFKVLGLTPAAGRLMTEDDEAADRPVAVIGDGYWQRRFNRSPDAIGKTLALGDRTYTIIGVTPARFWGLEPGRRVEVTLPIRLERGLQPDDTRTFFDAVARLAPGASVQQASAQANAVFQSWVNQRQLSGIQRDREFARLELASASRGTDGLRSRFAMPLYGLAFVAGAVLLIACANLGNLLLVRGAARERELAIRLATGAGAGRLFRQLLTETLLLFVLGAAASLVVAVLTIRTLAGFVAVGRLPILIDVQYDWRLALLAGGIALTAGLLTGLWPALQAVRTDPQAAMKDGAGRVAGSRRLEAAARVLGTGQVALSLVLVVAALVLGRTMINLRAVDLGFDGTSVATMSLDLRLPQESRQSRQDFWRQALERVRALPGVRTATLSVLTPLSGRNTSQAITVPGYHPGDEPDRLVRLNHVSEDYFQTFGIRVLRGRALAARDTASAARVAVVSEAAVTAYFGGRDPVGETLTLGESRAYQVVGVVRDHKHRSVREDAARFVYVPLWQPIDDLSRITLSVASTQPAAALSRTIADEMRALQPSSLISDVVSVDEQIDATLVTERLLSTLAAGFAILALVVAAIGLYGVLSYAVTRRTTEIGVRMALGEGPRRVAWSVFRGALGQMSAGLLLGLPVALLLVRTTEGLLFGVTSTDLSIYVLAAAVLMAVVCLAAWWPARRAARVDPLVALRHG